MRLNIANHINKMSRKTKKFRDVDQKSDPQITYKEVF